jgi:hypothetical protein
VAVHTEETEGVEGGGADFFLDFAVGGFFDGLAFWGGGREGEREGREKGEEMDK